MLILLSLDLIATAHLEMRVSALPPLQLLITPLLNGEK